MKPLRIINAMLGRGLGGIEQALVDYCEALKLAGHEVHAVAHPQAAIISELESKQIAFDTLFNLGAWDVTAVFRLKKMLRKFNPHLVIAHGNRALSLLKGAGASPLVAPMHNYKIKYQLASHVICPTRHLTQYVLAQHIPKDRVYTVSNMVRVPFGFVPHKPHIPPVIGSMGRLVAKKGFDVFIEALALLKNRKVAFRAILAGDGGESGKLAALAAKRGVEDLLTFTGWVEDKEAFFNNIDIFCLPSLHEPFGIVLLEAMAHGLPAVTTDSEGPAEIIEGGVAGLIVPKGNAAALADGLMMLLADPGRAQSMAIQAHEKVRQHFDLQHVAAKLDLAVRAICPL